MLDADISDAVVYEVSEPVSATVSLDVDTFCSLRDDVTLPVGREFTFSDEVMDVVGFVGVVVVVGVVSLAAKYLPAPTE